ncbi:MAG: HD domain-containing protein [Phycisphaerales bacterium]|nr:HD domain-containing protein [Phycisphaerales bacterium]
MKINNRTLLMTLVSTCQLACLAGGLLWFNSWLSDGLLARMRQQILMANEHFVRQAVDTVRAMNLTELKPSYPEWERVQIIIEQTRLPNDGFFSIIDSKSGRLLCHPELRDNPTLLTMLPGRVALENTNSVRRINSAARGKDSATGWALMPDGYHLIAVREIPELNVQVLAHQRERGIIQVISHAKAIIWSVGVIIAFIMLAATMSVTAMLVRRYEHQLADLNANLEQLAERRSRSLMKTRDAVIFGLAKLAESRHEDTGEHLERIHHYVEILARELARTNPKLDDELINTIAVASSLHDIGKVGVPDLVLLKAGKLTPRERGIMRRHTIIGGDCLLAIKRRLGKDDFDFLTTACQIALSHHERWNGTGYPFALKGDNIPLPGRIVALADVYDALTSDRVYKCAMSHEQALKLIVRGSGKQFDPAIVDAFLATEQEFAKTANQATGRDPMQNAA